MRPPLPYGQSEDAFSGFWGGKISLSFICVCAPGEICSGTGKTDRSLSDRD